MGTWALTHQSSPAVCQTGSAGSRASHILPSLGYCSVASAHPQTWSTARPRMPSWAPLVLHSVQSQPTTGSFAGRYQQFLAAVQLAGFCILGAAGLDINNSSHNSLGIFLGEGPTRLRGMAGSVLPGCLTLSTKSSPFFLFMFWLHAALGRGPLFHLAYCAQGFIAAPYLRLSRQFCFFIAFELPPAELGKDCAVTFTFCIVRNTAGLHKLL